MTSSSFWGNAGISAPQRLKEGRCLRERCFEGIWRPLVHYIWNPSTITSLHGGQSQESATRAIIGVEKRSRIPGGRFAMLHLVLLDKKSPFLQPSTQIPVRFQRSCRCPESFNLSLFEVFPPSLPATQELNDTNPQLAWELLDTTG